MLERHLHSDSVYALGVELKYEDRLQGENHTNIWCWIIVSWPTKFLNVAYSKDTLTVRVLRALSALHTL